MTLRAYRKLNDTAPDIVVEFRVGGAPMAIPVGTTATFKLVSPTGTTVHSAATAVVDAANGRVTYVLQNGDLALKGTYRGEFNLTVAPLNQTQHVPRRGFIEIEVSGTL